MLNENLLEDGPLRTTYVVCLDKGTYDAVSLNPDNSSLQRERYACSVRKLTRPDGGLFIITSCNWTKDELVEQFKRGEWWTFKKDNLFTIHNSAYIT